MKKITAMLLISFLSAFSYAQQKSSVRGILVDSSKHSNKISYATISLYNLVDSNLVAYKLSDPKGEFAFSSIPFGKYKMVISAFQYNIYRKEIILSEAISGAKDTLFLIPKNNALEEVVINSERPPIIVRKDTIEFNAESFKTLPTAVVEDLLKKLQGVVIGRNGEISFNGRTVSRILVDGKEFFEGDVQIASKNYLQILLIRYKSQMIKKLSVETRMLCLWIYLKLLI